MEKETKNPGGRYKRGKEKKRKEGKAEQSLNDGMRSLVLIRTTKFEIQDVRAETNINSVFIRLNYGDQLLYHLFSSMCIFTIILQTCKRDLRMFPENKEISNNRYKWN